jgi:hypothetical protein
VPSNFNTNPVGIFSDDLTVLDGGTFSAGPENAFDGSEGTQANTGVTGRLQWAPSTPITVNTQLEIRVDGNMDGVWGTNATRPSSASGPVGWITFNDGDGNPATGVINATNPLVLSPNGFPGTSSFASLNAVRVDGRVLVDSTGEDYDLMADSPTQNYATLNPLAQVNPTSSLNGGMPGGTAPYRRANLEGNSAGIQNGGPWPTTISIPPNAPNTYYWEMFVQAQASSQPQIGVIAQNTFTGISITPSYISYVPDGRIIQRPDNVHETVTVLGNGDTFTTGDVVACSVNTQTNTLTFFKNGEQQFQWTEYDFSSQYTEPVHYLTGAGDSFTVNYGQQPFLYQPSGTVGLQTQNLPAADIPNGRDHFQAITGPGTGSGATPGANQTAGNFSKDVYGNNNSVYDPDTTDKIFLNETQNFGPANMFNGTLNDDDWPGTCKSGTGSAQTWIYWRPDPAITDVTSLSINCSQTQTVRINGDNPTGQSNTTIGNIDIASPPATITSIAIQGNSISSATIGGIIINGNTLVDFSILSQAQQTFPNGLWWVKARKTDANTNQHQLVDSINGATSCRQLNAGTTGAYTAPAGNSVAWCWNWDQANPQTNGFNIVDFNATGDPVTLDTGLDNPEWIVYYSATSSNTFSGFRALGNGFFELNSPQQFLAGNSIQWQTGANAGEVVLDGARIGGAGKLFAWQSIPGYSAFGDFQGNSDNDGSFIYLGFRPQMLMLRTTGAGDSFFMLDSTRSPNNPIGADGLLNAGSTDPEGTWSARDIDFLSNGFKLRSSSGSINGGTVVYCAFSENPFGSSNTSPANAR